MQFASQSHATLATLLHTKKNFQAILVYKKIKGTHAHVPRYIHRWALR